MADKVSAVTTASVVKLVKEAPETVNAAKAFVVPGVVVFILMLLPLPTAKLEVEEPVIVPAPNKAPVTVKVLLPMVKPELIAAVATVKLPDMIGAVELMMMLEAEVGKPPHQFAPVFASAPALPIQELLVTAISVPLFEDETEGKEELILIL